MNSVYENTNRFLNKNLRIENSYSNKRTINFINPTSITPDWTVLDNCNIFINGGALIKYQGEPQWDSVIYASECVHKNGVFSASLRKDGTTKLIGITNQGSNDVNILDYAIKADDLGNLFVSERGEDKLYIGEYQDNDKISIIALNTGEIYYLLNNVIVYISDIIAKFPLYLQASFYDLNSSFGDIEFKISDKIEIEYCGMEPINKNLLKEKDDSLEDVIKEYKTHYSHKLLSEIQNSRVQMRKYSFHHTDLLVKPHFCFKDKCYEDYGKKIFINFNKKILTYGERKIARKMSQFKYVHIPLKEFVQTFTMTIDVFCDGVKVPHNKIDIVFADTNMIISIPQSYYKFKDLSLIIRPYLKEEYYSNEKVLNIKKSHKYRDFKVFTNGLYNKKFALRELKDVYQIEFEKEYEDIEIIHYNNFLGETIVRKESEYLKIDFGQSKFPVSENNFLSFTNSGKYCDTELRPITGNMFKVLNPMDTVRKIIFFYNETEYDKNNYTDKVMEFSKENNILRMLLLKKAPEFVIHNNLLNTEFSLIDKFKTDNLNYSDYIDTRFREVIFKEPEFYNKYLNSYVPKLKSHHKSLYFDLLKIDPLDYLRLDNTKEIFDKRCHTKFDFQKVLVKFDNKNNRVFNVYLDGNLLTNYINYYVNGCNYVYIEEYYCDRDSVIEVELFDDFESKNFDIETKIKNPRMITFENENEIESTDFISLFMYDAKLGRYYSINDIIDDIKIDKTNICVKLKNSINAGKTVYIRYNSITKINNYLVKERGNLDSMILDLKGFESYPNEPNHYKVYKNGRYISRKYCKFEFPDKSNGLYSPRLEIDSWFTIGDKIKVEYDPHITEEVYSEDLIDECGRIRIDRGEIPTPFNDTIYSYYLNGIKLNKQQYEIETYSGLQIKNVCTRKNFIILTKSDYRNKNVFIYSDGYKGSKNLYDDYVKEHMKGDIIYDQEPDIRDKAFNNIGDLYYKLYRTYLIYNLGDPNKPLPDNIRKEYDELIDKDNILLIDANMDLNNWMPLDANKSIENKDDEKQVAALYKALYYEYLQFVAANPTEVPDYIVEKYKQLINDDGSLVIDCNDDSMETWMPIGKYRGCKEV